MKITHNKIGQNLNLTDSSRTDKSGKASATKNSSANGVSDTKTDLLNASGFDSVKVDLSPRAQDIQKAKDIAKSAPDVDMAKVEKFQKLIDNGEYKIDAKSIADKMVNEHLLDLGASSND